MANNNENRLKILVSHSEDFMSETVKVVEDIDSRVIASVTTSFDAPEDNSCSRLQIAEQFSDIIEHCTGNRPIIL